MIKNDSLNLLIELDKMHLQNIKVQYQVIIPDGQAYERDAIKRALE